MQFYLLSAAVAPAVSTAPANQTINVGNTATFHCTASGNPVPTITWSTDGRTVGNGETLSFETLKDHSGEYWCTADNGFSDTASASAYLNVQCKYSETPPYENPVNPTTPLLRPTTTF